MEKVVVTLLVERSVVNNGLEVFCKEAANLIAGRVAENQRYPNIKVQGAVSRVPL